MLPKVIVFGSNHHNTLGVIRSLGEANSSIDINVILCAKNYEDQFVFRSRYIKHKAFFKTYLECCNYIYNTFNNEVLKPVIICTNDAAISEIDLNYEKFKLFFYFPNACFNNRINSMMDKINMINIAKSVGFKCPVTFTMQNLDLSENKNSQLIIKPRISIKGSKKDIQIFNKFTDFKKNNFSLNDDLLVQELVDKEFEYQLIGCSFFEGQKVIIPGYTKIIRSNPETNTGFLKFCSKFDFDVELDKCEKFIRLCRYSGLFSIEFIRTPLGENIFLEINFRNDGNAYVVTCAGLNLPYLWYKSAYMYDSLNLSIKVKDTFFMPEFVDFNQVKRRKISLINWISDVVITRSFAIYNIKDIKPFWFSLKRVIGKKLKSGL